MKIEKLNQNFSKKWLVAQIKANSYDLAIRNLERQGFQTFLPKMKVTIKKENKFINKDVFVFPGYIFVSVDLHKSDWSKINSTYGVLKLLAFNNKPSEIHNDLILALKNKYEINTFPKIKENLKKDDHIKFTNGPFVDLVARIEAIDEKNRIWVVLGALGQHRKIKIIQAEKINFTKFKV